MSDVLYDPQDNGDGTWPGTLSSQAYTTLLEDGFVNANTLSNSCIVCPFAPEVCPVLIGGTVVYYGAHLIISSGALQYLWNVFNQRETSPIGWPGSDPQVGPAGWTKDTAGNGDPIYISPDEKKSAHPDPVNEKEGPHWDYNDKLRKPKMWRVWPDGTMTPKKD